MKHVVVLLLFSVFLLPQPAPGQTSAATDSLRQLLRQQPRADTLRVQRLLALAHAVRVGDMPQAMQLNQQALTLARKLAYTDGQAEALLALSILYRRQTKYGLARRYAQQAQASFAKRNDSEGLGRGWLQMSWIDLLQGNYPGALSSALKGLPLTEKSGDLLTRTRLQINMGNIYSQLGDYTEALSTLRAALKNAQRLKDEQTVLMALNGLGTTYQTLKNWPQAIAYHQRSLRLSKKLGNVGGEISDEINLAEVYGRQGNTAEALAHGLRARQLVRATQDTYNLPSVELMLARAYLLANQTDSVLALAHHALELSQKSGSNVNIFMASQLLAEAYGQRRDFEQAYRYRNLQIAYDDSLSGEDIQRRTSALRYGYELDRKKAQIDLISKDRQLQKQWVERQRQQLIALLAGLAGLVLVAGLLLRNVFLKQRANRQLKEKNLAIAAHRDDLDQALTELRATQAQLVQHEKLASLGQLTAGVAHEIQNPLNFITNFSDLGVELTTELQEELAKEKLSERGRATIEELLHDLSHNQLSIHQHGRRADRIVKSMLEHSRASSGQPQPTDLNMLAEECLRLAHYSYQAANKDFKATLTTEFAPQLPNLQVVPQDLSRVLINLLTNAFYAVAEKRQQLGEAYQPEIIIRTLQTEKEVKIQVRDNGNGIPDEVRQRIFEPFFTTKPTGEGTGLGLSLSYDIITKGHRGTLDVDTKEGEYTEFTICLPLATAPQRAIRPATPEMTKATV
ncbi:tetratricopeptide repeat protein [Hymenobacter sp. BT188]|uniref:tetratricopeptide repeat protein n=1 Tax=Hymenobacter sp. BT188 TaxID=2763504 RepID=UPI00165105A1|nr:tetratricopeptide repeat protein [Hymenobacter sp. BT188]MBC6607591.1 tetratricopeptide repeat protein [Hymenobacter sp. BT188]